MNKNVPRACLLTCATVLTMAGVFLLPAAVNGFPFVFADTGTYVSAFINRSLPQDRPIYYSIFITLLDLRLSPWPSVIAQSVITAWVIWRFASSLFAVTTFFRMLSTTLFLTLGTSAAWFVGQLMPDIFTPLMILALASVCLTQESLSGLSTITLVVLIAAAVAFHQANFLVALWTLPALGLCALLGWRPSRPFLNGLFASGIAVTLGLAGLATVNLFAGRFALSNGGSVFLMARLLEDGTALRYLEQACPERHFAVCAYLDELKAYDLQTTSFPGGLSQQTTLSDYFLWRGPLDKLGGFRGEQPEASLIDAGTLSKYPLAQFRAAGANGWRQLFRFRTGDGLYAYPPTWRVSTAIDDVFGPVVYGHYRQSKQIRAVFGFNWFELLNRIHVSVLVASFVVLFGFFVLGGLRRYPNALFTSIFVSILVAANAFTLAALSGPNDRYQSRVIWLVPLLACCCVLAPRASPAIRRPGAHLPVNDA